MEKLRGFKILTFIALFLAVIGISVGYASFSTVLKLNGTASIKSQSWDVHFKSIASSEITATELHAPEIDEATTTISGLSLQFDEPGQSATYVFDVENSGTFDSIINAVTIGAPTCVGTGDNAVLDAQNVCNHIDISLQNSAGEELTTGLELGAKEKLEDLKLVISYDSAISTNELPTNDVTINDIAASILFVQN